MSEFKLEVDLPFSKPNIFYIPILFRKVSYPQYLWDYRYYSKIIREIIRVASDCQYFKKKEVYNICNC